MYATENLLHLKAFLDALKAEIAGLKIRKRAPHRYAFDSLSEETLSKAFALANAVVILIENDLPEEALGLSRSIVECALNLRWITADRALIQTRSLRFVQFGLKIKSYWYWWVKKRLEGTEQGDDADRYAKEWDLVADRSEAYKHWSGERQFTRTSSLLKHPMNMDSSTEELFAMRQAHDYFHPSCFVHCSQPGLDNYFSDDPVFAIHAHKSSDRDYAREAILICNAYLYDLVAYSFYGMNVTLHEMPSFLANHNLIASIAEYRFTPDA